MQRPSANWHTLHQETLTRGERAADRLRNGMGSWTFVCGFVAFMVAWGVVNGLDVAWDPLK